MPDWIVHHIDGRGMVLLIGGGCTKKAVGAEERLVGISVFAGHGVVSF